MHAWIRHGGYVDPHGISSMIESTIFHNCLVVSAETGLKQLDSTIYSSFSGCIYLVRPSEAGPPLKWRGDQNERFQEREGFSFAFCPPPNPKATPRSRAEFTDNSAFFLVTSEDVKS